MKDAFKVIEKDPTTYIEGYYGWISNMEPIDFDARTGKVYN